VYIDGIIIYVWDHKGMVNIFIYPSTIYPRIPNTSPYLVVVLHRDGAYNMSMYTHTCVDYVGVAGVVCVVAAVGVADADVVCVGCSVVGGVVGDVDVVVVVSVRVVLSLLMLMLVLVVFGCVVSVGVDMCGVVGGDVGVDGVGGVGVGVDAGVGGDDGVVVGGVVVWCCWLLWCWYWCLILHTGISNYA